MKNQTGFEAAPVVSVRAKQVHRSAYGHLLCTCKREFDCIYAVVHLSFECKDQQQTSVIRFCSPAIRFSYSLRFSDSCFDSWLLRMEVNTFTLEQNSRYISSVSIAILLL